MANRIVVRKNGPLILKGQIRVLDTDGNQLAYSEDTEKDDHIFLCRCGASKNKPFCDGEHKRCGFEDAASINDTKQEDIGEPSDTLTVTVRKGAMCIAKSGMIIENEDGTGTTTRDKAALCRCGVSKNKPFCDGSHKQCHFDED